MNIRTLSFFIFICILFVSCKEESNSNLNNINAEEVELSCTKINNNINSLVSLLDVMQKQDYVTSYSPVIENYQTVGYTFSFNKSLPIVIYDKFELDIPVIGIKSDSDNNYYWTVNEDWIVDENTNKISISSVPKVQYTENNWYAVFEGMSNIKLNTNGKSFLNKIEPVENGIILQLFNETVLQLPNSESECFITKFEFKAEDNPEVLLNDLSAEIEGNNIYVRIPHIVQNKILKPSVTFIGDNVTFDGAIDEYINFSEPKKCTVSDNKGNNKEYTVMVTAFTGLPIMYIETEGGAEIVSKDEYVNATVSIKNDLITRSVALDLETTAVRIKGRGNSTWKLPKKPYKLKFDSKVSLLGEPNDKEWVLLANYTDKTNLRNATAFFMGEEMTDLEWTPCTHFVELILNGVYKGTYQLSEQVKISDKRVNVSDDGYLLEVDQLSKLDEDDVYFQTDRILLNIKEPDVEYDTEAYNWIKNYITKIENVLYSENFLDKDTGYAQYIDMQSYVDWYIIQEIAKNNDGIFFSSCYMNLAPDGKLKMGPLWDFDIAFGNVNYNNNMDPTGFYIKDAAWISRMCEDPTFMKMVRERFDEIYNIKNVIYNYINENADYLKYSVVENNSVWKTLYTYTWPNYYIWGSYENEVQCLKDFIAKRLDWLNNNLPK